MVLGELKIKSSKSLFKKLNEHSKNLQIKQEEIINKHNSLVAKVEELEHLKVNMNDYLGRNKTEKKKESVIGDIKKYKIKEYVKSTYKKRNVKEVER